MPPPPIQLEAIKALGTSALVLIGCLGGIIVMTGISQHMRRPTWWWDAAILTITFVAVLTICWLMFNPAIYAMKILNGPGPFVAAGLVLSGALFYLRTVRKDIYGAVEVAVAIATLAFVGSNYSPNKLGTDVIGFVGAVYVLVRGFTNIAEKFQRRKAS